MKMNMRSICIQKQIVKEVISQLIRYDFFYFKEKKKYEEKNFMYRDNKSWKAVYLFNNLGSLIEEDLKIFIIDENDYNIMLLAEEY